MKTLIVLVFIAFGEPPKVIDVYQTSARCISNL
jgi:hypothetical protein